MRDIRGATFRTGKFRTGSMGAIDVSLSNPSVIYAGTGSSKIRSNVSIGRGIYKSTDAGQTWNFHWFARHGPDCSNSDSSHESGRGFCRGAGGAHSLLRRSVEFTRLRTAARAGSRCSFSRIWRARRIWSCSRGIPTWFLLVCGMHSASRGRSLAERWKAAFINRAMPARRGRSWGAACLRNYSDVRMWRSPPRNRTVFMR